MLPAPAPRARRWARPAGFALGVVVAALALTTWRVPGGAGALGVEVSVAARTHGALGVSPPDPFVVAGPLRPGDVASGTFMARNDTASARSVRASLSTSPPGVEALFVRVSAGPEVLLEGPLGAPRPGAHAFALGAGESRPVEVQVWLAATAGDALAGRAVAVTVAVADEATTAPAGVGDLLLDEREVEAAGREAKGGDGRGPAEGWGVVGGGGQEVGLGAPEGVVAELGTRRDRQR